MNKLKFTFNLLLYCCCIWLSNAFSQPAEQTVKNDNSELTLLTFTIDSFYAQPIYEQHPARELIRTALANLGYRYQLRYIKGPRSLTMANNGEVDGELARSGDHTKEFAKLVFVPEPINSVHSIIVSRRSLAGDQRQWRYLSARNRVVIAGSRVGKKVPEPFNELPVVNASDYDQALKLVASERADMVIIPANFNFLADRFSDAREKLVVLEPSLEEESAYMHLHIKHKALAAPLALELKKLKHVQQIQ